MTATYAYDSLDRNTTTTYSDGTPTVTYTYDSGSVTNGRGRRTGMSDGAGSSTFHYDVMGRTTKIIRAMTGGPSVTGDFVYNYLGGLTQSKWPGVYDYGANPLGIYLSYDSAGRQQTAKWSNNGGGAGGTAYQELVDNYAHVYATTDPYATETITYDGATNGTIEAVTYNERLQPKLHTVKYGSLFRLNQLIYFNKAGTNQNNGNVWEVDDQVDSHGDMKYEYDTLNRIWKFKINDVTNQTFTADGWGNSSASGLTFSSTTNRITTSGYNSYDSAGNQLGLPGFTLQYDGASRIKTVNNGTAATYSYDGDGRRVKKVAGGVTRYYFYDPEGNPTWEYQTGVGWETFNLFFNGKHIAINNTTEGLRWRHLDHLGNLRLKTNNLGDAVCYYYYKPYGEISYKSCTEADDYWFTSKERDAETGLDYFGARHYGSAIESAELEPVCLHLEQSSPLRRPEWRGYLGRRGRFRQRVEQCVHLQYDPGRRKFPEPGLSNRSARGRCRGRRHWCGSNGGRIGRHRSGCRGLGYWSRRRGRGSGGGGFWSRCSGGAYRDDNSGAQCHLQYGQLDIQGRYAGP